MCLPECFPQRDRHKHQQYIVFFLFFSSYFIILVRFHYFEGIRQKRKDVKIEKSSTDVGFNLDSSVPVQQADI